MYMCILTTYTDNRLFSLWHRIERKIIQKKKYQQKEIETSTYNYYNLCNDLSTDKRSGGDVFSSKDFIKMIVSNTLYCCSIDDLVSHFEQFVLWCYIQELTCVWWFLEYIEKVLTRVLLVHTVSECRESSICYKQFWLHSW